ncbi:ABC transporter permease [Saccharopolyspora sp. K220]|uniref:ABC transporter permease n=1 Tax=Saccharopolyspora soli TaxID=2926618 RepID=UPI001F564EF8|nr:ABC transporter permease [Saccharopolyspora soli]MCI2415901.1 ABC transporter permease [Saccharopolyspora soli]
MTTTSAPQTVEALRAAWYAGDVGVEARTYWAETWRRFRRNRVGLCSLAVLVLLVGAAVFAPLLTPHDPLVGEPLDRLAPLLSAGHPLGTDELGRDMVARLLHGGRLSLLAGFAPTLVATLIGTLIGTWAGFSQGVVGTVLMRAMDMIYAFPAILLAIAVSAALGPGLRNAIVAVTIVFIPPVARVAEQATRAVVVQEYMEAARLSGAGRFRLVRTQLLPNVLNEIIVYASGLVGVAMVIAASLSFLGLASQPPTPEWGYMLEGLRGSIYLAPEIVVLPGIFIFVTSVAFNTFSDALREAMNTRLS